MITRRDDRGAIGHGHAEQLVDVLLAQPLQKVIGKGESPLLPAMIVTNRELENLRPPGFAD
jgi:hypothetical protein